MTSPLETLAEHASKAQAAIQAQRDSAAQIAAQAAAARDQAQQGGQPAAPAVQGGK
jgi:hypothetical protein